MKPIEKLYLISKEKEEIYSLKNKLYCLLYQLTENKNIIFKDGKFKINITGKNFNDAYESSIADMIKRNEFVALDVLLNGIHFQPCLIQKGYIEEKPNSGFLGSIFNKKSEKRTNKYLQFQLDINKQLNNIIDILDLLCPNQKYKMDILRLYNKITAGIKESYKKKSL